MASASADKKLTIGTATYDEFDEVYFTIQAIRLYHPEVAGEIEFLILDNHPGGPCSEALRQFAGSVSDVRCLATDEIRGTAVRDLIFREAETPYVLCVDSHVFIVPGAIRKLIDYLEERPDCRDLLQGPVLHDEMRGVSTHMSPNWRRGMFGYWGTDDRGDDPDHEPFEIAMQGLGLFACRKDAWLGFNPRFSGFGGEEGYIHEKFRQAGRRTLCLPFLRWLHRFLRAGVPKYPNIWRQRFRNYFIGHHELGLDREPLIAHFSEYLNEKAVAGFLDGLERELASPYFAFDAIYCITPEPAGASRESMQRRFEHLEIDHRVRWLDAEGGAESDDVGSVLAHREILARAHKQGLANVLVFEDGAVFRAYHRPVFRRILDAVPADADGVREWLETEVCLGTWLRSNVDQRFLACPSVEAPPPALIGSDRPAAQTAGAEPPRRRRRKGPELKSDKKLTIGMSTYDDFDGVYFTVQAIRMYHPEVADEIELIVLDNHPGGPSAEALGQLADAVPEMRYLATEAIRGTAVRDLVFREAETPYVVCIDSHVFVVPGALRRLLAYLEERPDCRDLLQGPLLYDDLRSISTHFDPQWSAGMYGVWGTDERGSDPDGEPFEIPMQGLGLFACRTDAWPGFNPRFAGFGGEEGYIHEKFRQAGGRTLCLPFLRWVHRFQRPGGIKYPNVWRDRIRNYLIGHDELGLDREPLIAHFRERHDPESFGQSLDEITREMASPLFYFDAIYCISLVSATGRRQRIQRRFEQLGIAHRVRWFDAVETPESHHIGCALSHRAILEQARKQGLGNVLVFEDDAVFLEDTLEHLAKSVAELRAQDWNVFHLGGRTWDRSYPGAPGCRHLLSVPPGPGLTCTEALAYHRQVFDRILGDVPEDAEGVRAWLETVKGFDQYLRRLDKRFLARPKVASQPSILPAEDPALRHRYTLGNAEPETHGPAEPLTEVAGVFELSPDWGVSELDGRAVLTKTQRVQTLNLNGTAALILGLLDGRRSTDEIRELLVDAYPESAADVARDVERTLRDLYHRGAVQRSERRIAHGHEAAGSAKT